MPHHVRRFVFPFTAIVGQEKMKKALILNAINPRIGGVLIRGQKGTAKSTAVRALADLLPEIYVVEGCPFNCNPFDPAEMCDICYEKYERSEQLPAVKRKVRIVNLPLNATADRVVGSLDIKRAIKEGIKALEPGLLAEANRGILYIDEVNLLDDYVADILLDAAASGVNVVEREGISVAHPAKFILIGTMNPEEGELRPQLLDRFGLQVEVEEIRDPRLRVEIIRRVEEFENDPLSFLKKYEHKQRDLRDKIERARELLKNVEISEDLLLAIAEICIKLEVASHRAEITVTRTAKTIAAFDGRKNVREEDIIEALELALPHRLRKRPFERPQIRQEDIEKVSEEVFGSKKLRSRKDFDSNNDDQDEKTKRNSNNDRNFIVFDIGSEPTIILPGNTPLCSGPRVRRTGRRLKAKGNGKRGVYVSYTIPRNGDVDDIAIDATIRAAALKSPERRKYRNDVAVIIEDEDIREKIRRQKLRSLILLVVDASGSMAALRRMEAAKGAAMAILRDAYIHRDKVCFIEFHGTDAQVLLPPTDNLELAAEILKELPTGGKTPLSAGIAKAIEVIELESRKYDLRPIVIIITDGKANVPLGIGSSIKWEIMTLSRRLKELGAITVVVDTSPPQMDIMGIPRYINEIVEAASAKLVKLPEPSESALYQLITGISRM
ncbi:MAG: magnesium chelatase subunit D family protein [Candidatus Baldrarchaeia archaeon]